jgi:formylglycine-generating enzyme required for sulfatase activity
MSWINELKEIRALLDDGTITQAEFDAEKAKIIAKKDRLENISNPALPSPSTPESGSGLKIGMGVGIVALVGIGVWMGGGKEAPMEPTESKAVEVPQQKAELPKKITGDGYEAVLVPAGTFTLGCTKEQGSDCYDWEKPAHQVTISRPYYLMRSEVTQSLYESVTGKNPSHFKGSDLPVEQVSWYDAVRFANALSKKEGLGTCYTIGSGEEPSVKLKGLDCQGWRLPTSAEWEWAARGAEEAKYMYSGGDSIGDVGWYSSNSGSKTHPVCKLKTNALGLCDMSGNVWEWVWDGWGDYSSASATDPKGKEGSSSRVFRGGSWNYDAGSTRVSYRDDLDPGIRYFNIGFRPQRAAAD